MARARLSPSGRTGEVGLEQNRCMDALPAAPRIVYADRLANGIVIAFENGKCAFYSASLLHETFHDAEPVNDDEPEETG